MAFENTTALEELRRNRNMNAIDQSAYQMGYASGKGLERTNIETLFAQMEHQKKMQDDAQDWQSGEYDEDRDLRKYLLGEELDSRKELALMPYPKSEGGLGLTAWQQEQGRLKDKDIEGQKDIASINAGPEYAAINAKKLTSSQFNQLTEKSNQGNPYQVVSDIFNTMKKQRQDISDMFNTMKKQGQDTGAEPEWIGERRTGETPFIPTGHFGPEPDLYDIPLDYESFNIPFDMDEY